MSTNPSEKVREILAEADREKRVAGAAESARSSIRLGVQPRAKRGLLFFRRYFDDGEYHLSTDETQAVYRALVIVRDEAQGRADRLEASVTTEARS